MMCGEVFTTHQMVLASLEVRVSIRDSILREVGMDFDVMLEAQPAGIISFHHSK